MTSKPVRNVRVLPDLSKEGYLTKDIVLCTKEKWGVPVGCRLFSHHTLASVRKMNFYHPFHLVEDSLDFILASTYNQSTECDADREDVYLQAETKGCTTWRRMRNTVEKFAQPPVVLGHPMKRGGITEHKSPFSVKLMNSGVHSSQTNPGYSRQPAGDLDVSYKRSRRVRSWYLYEQLKSLERNQIDAALRLRDRSFQDQVLRQELSERRDRRTLYTRSGESHDSLLSRAQRIVKSEGADSIHTDSIDDLFLSFSELYDSGFAASVVIDDLSEQSCHEDAAAVEDECKSLGEQEENASVAQSMQSVVCVESDGTITGFKDHCYEECEVNCVHSLCEEDICEEQVPDDSHDTVVKEINYYFDELKDNLEKIEKLAEYDCDICEDQRIESDSGCSVEEELPVKVINEKSSVHARNKNTISIWSKVVSFAHQVVELNHGNCYSDYGSQILTAVLACDVLCRGISKICEILQPFVCPVRNCASSDSDCSDCYCYKREKRKIKHIPKRGRCRCTNKPFKRNSIVHISRTYCSDNWQRSQNATANRTNPEKARRMSEPYVTPLRSQKLFSKRNTKKYYDGSFINEYSYETSNQFFVRKNNRPQCNILNDIMKLSQYFDNILKDLEETMQVSNLS